MAVMFRVSLMSLMARSWQSAVVESRLTRITELLVRGILV